MGTQDSKLADYLQYLDKEMTIMGILSGFCLAALSFGLDAIMSVENSDQLGQKVWLNGHWLVLTGAMLLLAAAYFFYVQRSHLAWHYGTIAYWIASDRPTGALEWVKVLQESPRAWNLYFHAHGMMILAFVAFLLALISAVESMEDYIAPINGDLAIVIASSSLLWIFLVLARARRDRRNTQQTQKKIAAKHGGA